MSPLLILALALQFATAVLSLQTASINRSLAYARRRDEKKKEPNAPSSGS